jgi:hypothetical protein
MNSGIDWYFRVFTRSFHPTESLTHVLGLWLQQIYSSDIHSGIALPGIELLLPGNLARIRVGLNSLPAQAIGRSSCRIISNQPRPTEPDQSISDPTRPVWWCGRDGDAPSAASSLSKPFPITPCNIGHPVPPLIILTDYDSSQLG